MIADKIKKIRKDNQLSQPAFRERLGVSRDIIASYEIGRVEPRKEFLILLCREFNINESWLSTGEGEMYRSVKTDEELTEIIAHLAYTENRRAIETIKKVATLNEKDLIFVDRMIEVLKMMEK